MTTSDYPQPDDEHPSVYEVPHAAPRKHFPQGGMHQGPYTTYSEEALNASPMHAAMYCLLTGVLEVPAHAMLTHVERFDEYEAYLWDGAVYRVFTAPRGS